MNMFRIQYCYLYFLVIVYLQLCGVNVLAIISNPIKYQHKPHQEMIMEKERPYFASHKTKRGAFFDRFTFHERRFRYSPEQSRKNGPEAERARKAKKMEKEEEEKREKIYRQYLANPVHSSALRDFFSLRY
jgi:hypothetical protein